MDMARYTKTKFTGVFCQQSATRRHQGRPDLAWYIVYPFNGKRKWEKIGWASEGYTAAFANQVRAKRIQNVRGHIEISTSSARDYTLDEAWAIVEERHTRHLTMWKDEKVRYNTHIGPTLGSYSLSAVKPEDVEKIKTELLEKGKAPATVRHVIGQLRRIYNFMAKWDLYQGANPTTHVVLPRADNSRSRFLTREEAEALLASLKIRSKYVYCLTMFSLYTGMRAGEIMNLRGEHIDLPGGRIRVVDTKTKKDRTVYLSSPLKTMLADFDIKPGELVLRRPKGGSYSRVSHVFDRVVKELGFNAGRTDRRDLVVFHSLRHTFASWLVSQGQPLYTVGQLLGHSKPEMTQRYAHLIPEIQRAAVETIENYFNAH
jgi:integrase